MSRIETQRMSAHTKYVSGPRLYEQQTSMYSTRQPKATAVDPVLLYAKLEVAKLEQDTARRMRKERKTQHLSVQGRNVDKRASVLQPAKELRHGALEVYMADGKPCVNTAQLLAAFQTSPSIHAGVIHKAGSLNDLSRRKDDNSGGSTENDAKEGASRRRRFKHEEGPYKLVPVKHGSQTTYERVDLPSDPALIEHSEATDDDEHGVRPRLSKYDRPHWAQQSQNAAQMHSLRAKLHNAASGFTRRSGLPHHSEEPTKISSRH